MSQLETLRINIDTIDAEIMELLGIRFSLTKKVGQFKAGNDVNSVDPGREKTVMAKWVKLAVENEVNEVLAKKVARLVIDEVVANHNKLKKLN